MQTVERDPGWLTGAVAYSWCMNIHSKPFGSEKVRRPSVRYTYTTISLHFLLPLLLLLPSFSPSPSPLRLHNAYTYAKYRIVKYLITHRRRFRQDKDCAYLWIHMCAYVHAKATNVRIGLGWSGVDGGEKRKGVRRVSERWNEDEKRKDSACNESIEFVRFIGQTQKHKHKNRRQKRSEHICT